MKGWIRPAGLVFATCALKESSKNSSLKLNSASHNNTSWYTDTDGFLEHSPRRGGLYYKGLILQKIIPGFLGSPLIWLEAENDFYIFKPLLRRRKMKKEKETMQ